MRVRLTPNTIFLADFFAKNYIAGMRAKNRQLTKNDLIDVSHAALFLACKMRERDIFCPMIPHILMAGGKLTPNFIFVIFQFSFDFFTF